MIFIIYFVNGILEDVLLTVLAMVDVIFAEQTAN
jgi:hypothetical protein